MQKQNNMLSEKNKSLPFRRILINDSTRYELPKKFYKEFKGSGGPVSKSAIKIQLQYDLLSGNFSTLDFFDATSNDAEHLETMEGNTNEGDLRLADLGYFNASYLGG